MVQNMLHDINTKAERKHAYKRNAQLFKSLRPVMKESSFTDEGNAF